MATSLTGRRTAGKASAVVVSGASTPARGVASVLVRSAFLWSDRVVRTAVILAAAQLRNGWRSLIGIVVLVGLAGGLVLAGLAGASRTASAVDRMIEATDAADALINPNDGDASALDFEKVAALPMVADFSRVHGVLVIVNTAGATSLEELLLPGTVFASDGGAPFEFDRPIMIEGRMADPTAVDEVYLDRTFAAAGGLGVGDVVQWRIPRVEEIEKIFTTDFEQGEAAALALFDDPGFGTPVKLKVVGVGNGVEGVVVDRGFEPVAAWITPALYAELGEPSAGYGGAFVRLTSPGELSAFRTAVDALAPDEKIVYQTAGVTRAKAVRGTQPAAVALAIFAGVTALLGLLLVGQTISRRCQLDGRDNLTLAALGATQRDRWLTMMVRLALAAAAGVATAVTLAVALSWFTPVGPARNAEPDPGWSINPPVLLAGAAILFFAVLFVSAIPAWRTARLTKLSSLVHGSSAARWLAACGASPNVTTGVRFGLEPGRGASAVPTRATIIGAATAVAVATATMVFAASLGRVVDDGRFYGSNFDAVLTFEGDETDDGRFDDVLGILGSDPDVERLGELRVSEIVVDGSPVTAITFSDGEDAVRPTIAAGRAPSAAGEIALGSTTMNELNVSIGDEVSVTTSGFEGASEVVGRVVLPGVGLYQGSDRTSIGVGALVAPQSLGPRNGSSKSALVVDFVAGADRQAFEIRTTEALDEYGKVFFQDDPRPSDIESLERLQSLPVVLAAMLVVLVAVTVVHAMAVAVRRRRRDLAILQAMGATSSGVTAVGIWQGVTIGVTGLLIGVPLGIVGGRWLWMLLANGFGTLAEPVLPLVAVILLVVTVVALAAVVGAVPVRRGLRHRPCAVLNSE